MKPGMPPETLPARQPVKPQETPREKLPATRLAMRLVRPATRPVRLAMQQGKQLEKQPARPRTMSWAMSLPRLQSLPSPRECSLALRRLRRRRRPQER